MDGTGENSRVIRTLFMKPEMFGVGIVHLRRLVHQETRRGARWLDETPIREEFEWVLARLRETNSLSRGLPRSRGSPLLPAADWGQLLLVILFLHFGADPNEQDEFGNKALFVANERPESENEIQSLLKYGCNLNHQTYEGLTLFSKCYFQNTQAFYWEIEASIEGELRHRCQRYCWTPRADEGHCAWSIGNDRVTVEWRLRYKRPTIRRRPHLPRRRGPARRRLRTGIVSSRHYAALAERFCTCGGQTALMGAVILGHVQIVKLLPAKDCDLQRRNNENNTAIELARLFHEDQTVKI